MSGVLLPLAVTLAVQVLGALAHLTLPVLASEAAGDFGLDAGLIGFYSGMIFVGAASASLLSGGLVIRHGPVRVSQACLLLAAAGLLLLTAGAPALLPFSAFLIGFGYGPLTPASSHILARRSPPRFLSLIFSVKQTGVPLGYAVAGFMLPALTVLHGWRAGIVAAAGLCVAVSVILQPVRDILDDDRGGRRPVSIEAIVGPIRLVWGHWPLRRLAIASLAFSAMQLGVTAFLVTYLAERVGLGLVKAGVALSTAQIAAIAGRILWGALADRLVPAGVLLALLGFGMTGAIVATALFTTAWPFWAILLVSLVLGATVIGWNGVFLAETARQAPPGRIGEATGGVLFLTFSGAVMAPPLLSVLVAATGTYTTGFLLLGALTSAVGMLFIVARSDTAAAHGTQR